MFTLLTIRGAKLDDYKIIMRRFSEGYRNRILLLRFEVFVDEQKVPLELEIDKHDSSALHLAALDEDEVIGTLRMVEANGKIIIGRLVVKKRHRNKGIGRKLMLKAISYAKEKQFQGMELDSQLPVIPFYEKLGFQTVGDVFDDAGIPHKKMLLTFS